MPPLPEATLEDNSYKVEKQKRGISHHITVLFFKDPCRSLIIFMVAFGEGSGNPFQYSCLGNPTDREAWPATVHEVGNESDMTEQLTLSL